ncbi:MAG: MiaB/RimO family radical SAM methylthiotransferase [Solirubrobacterales bacterium]
MPRYHVTTFGCQMNEHDSERMKGMLESLGYREAAERAEADLILFNTCSIRETADSRFVAHLGEAKRLKRERPERIVGVGGCWAQSVKEEVFERFPFVDVAFGPGQVHRLAEFLTSDSLTAQGYFEFEGFTGRLPAHRERPYQGWVQISVGCNCRCSYCIVPSTRGREVSRPFAELVAEVHQMAAEGVREVTLLGQNVNSYGRDLGRAIAPPLSVGSPAFPPARGGPPPASHPSGVSTTSGAKLRGRRSRSFAELLHALDAIEGIERIRYTSPHPKDMREDVIRAHAELPSVCEHIHLPLQSGSSRILKAMRRTYDRERYLDRVALIREHVPDVALTTDIIVGFPGESEEDFAQTLEVVEQVRYDSAFTFIFSPRRGTEAAEITEGVVPHPVKVERMERLVEAVQRHARERAQRFVGRTLEVLVEGPSRTDPERLRGRTRHNKVVNFAGLAVPGELTQVRIDSATSQTLAGEELLPKPGDTRLRLASPFRPARAG